jgi:chemotaxis-related protein WspD
MIGCWREIGIAGNGTCERLPEMIHCRNCAEYSRGGRELFDRPASPELLEEWNAALAAAKERAKPGTLSVVVFRLHAEWFALRTALFVEVTEQRSPHTVPFRTGATFTGLVNVNGELLLSVSLARLLGVADSGGAPPVRPRTCVVTRERERVAFPVDEVLGVRRVEEAALKPAPVTVAKSPAAHTVSLFECDGRNVGLLDEEKLFAALGRNLSW